MSGPVSKARGQNTWLPQNATSPACLLLPSTSHHPLGLLAQTLAIVQTGASPSPLDTVPSLGHPLLVSQHHPPLLPNADLPGVTLPSSSARSPTPSSILSTAQERPPIPISVCEHISCSHWAYPRGWELGSYKRPGEDREVESHF